jgi:hypothetical protein
VENGSKGSRVQKNGSKKKPLKLGYTEKIHADYDCLLCRTSNGARLLPHCHCCSLAVFKSV